MPAWALWLMLLPMILAFAPRVTTMPSPLPWIVFGAATGSATGKLSPIRADDVSVIPIPATGLSSIVLSLMVAWALRLTWMPVELPRIVLFRT